MNQDAAFEGNANASDLSEDTHLLGKLLQTDYNQKKDLGKEGKTN